MLYIQSFAGPPRPAPDLETTMYLPSGVHSGDVKPLSLPLVICAESLRSSDMVQTLSPPLRSETNATFLPSGEKRGCEL